MEENPFHVQNIKEGSIVTLKYIKEIRGVELKPKSPKEGKEPKWFRNSFTVVIILDKPINFKIYNNGTFQMTGCKNKGHAEKCVKRIWELMKDQKHMYSFKWGTYFNSFFIPALRNIDFNLGFIIDREKLARYISMHTELRCFLETSFGYTGVNIKIPTTKNINTLRLRKIKYKGDAWKEKLVPYSTYLQLLSAKEKITKLTQRKATALVFHSGKCILSGLTSAFMKSCYYEFIDLIKTCYDEIEERLDV